MCASMRGEYWCCTGADDLFYPTFLEKRVEMHGIESAGLSGAWPAGADSMNPGAGAGRGPRLLELPAQLCPPRSLEVLLQHDVINAPSVMVRSSVTRQVLAVFPLEMGVCAGLVLLDSARGDGVRFAVGPAGAEQIPRPCGFLEPDAGKGPAAPGGGPSHAFGGAAYGGAILAMGRAEMGRWGRTLYWRWLRQAVALKVERGAEGRMDAVGRARLLRREGKEGVALGRAGKAFVGPSRGRFPRHRRAQRRQSFIVSGLAQIEDPIFR